MKVMRLYKSLLVFWLLVPAFNAQAQNFWSDIPEIEIAQNGERQIVPDNYRTIRFDFPVLQKTLLKWSPNTSQAVIFLPLPDGRTEQFNIHPATVMAPELQAKYPEIRCYTGVGINDPTARIKCDLTPWGFHAMISSAKHDLVFIDPYSRGNAECGVVYFKKDYQKRANAHYNCGVTGKSLDASVEAHPQAVQSRSSGPDGNARLYRLALACTGEYAQFQGGTKPLVLAAMITSMNRVNGVYENEFAVSMQIIAKTDTLIFLDGATDPYTNDDGGTMLGENKQTCNARIGLSNYDIGHVFSTAGGGIAGLGVVCTSSKAEGVTGQESPVGDPFDIDYVAHEMGHQFDGNHTQNNNCNRAGATSVEPGSASTIMGYAGICAPDVQPHSDAYFHGINVAEVLNFITAGDGNGCPVKTVTGNAAPSVLAGADYSIPRLTPFALTASGADSDSNTTLTYCWEQMDAEVATQPPASSSAKGPMFRSLNPTQSPTRYFPNLQDLLQQTSNNWEKLPGVGRQMKFRVTVRDNFAGGGSTVFDDMVLTVAAAAGPFKLTTPAANAVWQSGTFQDVKWDVSNTDKAPILCKNVRILLSLDGGSTFPEVLAAEVPNIGQYCVLVPEVATNSARIKIESIGNVFFDVSRTDIKIEAAQQPGFTFCPGAFNAQICLPETYHTTISTRGQAGFNTPVTFSANNLPAGADATFSPNPAAPGTDVDMTIHLPTGIAEGNYAVDIVATSPALNVSVTTHLTVVSNDFSALALQIPANGATNMPQSIILRWNPAVDANGYEVEIASNPSFDAASMVASNVVLTSDTFKIPTILPKASVFYWHVRAKNECGPGDWSEPYVFATVVESCTQRAANDLPITISANSTPTVESKIIVPVGELISDVNIKQVKGSHEFFKDLQFTLISPQGTQVQLFKDKCGGYNGSFNFGFDDAATGVFPCPPPNNGQSYRAQFLLSAFNGQNSTGTWTLQVKDNAIGSAGLISDFSLEFCVLQVQNPPFLVQNNPLQLDPGSNQAIPTALLQVSDANNGPGQLVFTLMTLPQHGLLQKGGVELKVGDHFTQADIDGNLLRYYDYGSNAGSDAFRFSVTDGEGGMISDIFHIQPFALGTTSPNKTLLFALNPNPARETVRLSIPESFSVQSVITLTDISGRQIGAWTLEPGATFLQIGVADLPSGVYVVGFENALGKGIQKLVLR
ncbi:MAG: reprolysin-like metallopeptidase [Bacteroidota bacterium]